ncbi:LuxR family transcriptional regulator [Pseudonocardia eucalypti]|uniref:LuxR family transcriptional regulator n=2 Tax=Pseudonocardia eucalypti TaxID=648755 RepID=A0ABP9QK34_9PSEU
MAGRYREQRSASRSEWRLVGRKEELRALRASVVEDGNSVVLAGRTGVGKSRLGQEALEVFRAAGFPIARVTATRASGGIPLGAFAPVLQVRDPEPGAVDNRANLLRRCADALVARAGQRPLVLGVDDAHLLDEMSATLVFQLAETRSVIILATVRSGEPAPDPILALWKSGIAERIELDGLGQPEVTEAVTAALGGQVDEAAITELMTRSRGNMLFLRELVAGALADGVLRDDGGIWRLVGELHPTDRLVELVEARLEGLTPEERSLMEIVAFGEPLGPAELVRMSDEAVAESLERKALLRTSIERSRLLIRLGHPLYGEVLRERIPGLRARAIARSLAESIEATGARRREDLLRIATWRLIGGGAEPDLMYRAAVEARWRYDFGLAEQLIRAALEEGAGFEAALLAAQLASLRGRTVEADVELGELARSATNSEELGHIALTRLDNRVIYSGKIDEGLRIAKESEENLPPSEMRDEIAARRVALLLAKEGPRSAVTAVEPLLGRATGRALAWACMPGAFSLARMGRIEEALDAARRGYEAQVELTVPTDWYPWMHAFYQAEALNHAGRFLEAEQLSTARYQEGVENRSLEQQAMFSWQLAKPVAERGHIGDAVRNAQKAISIYRQLGRPQFIDFCLIYLSQALALAGQEAEAREALDDLDRLGMGPSYFMGVDFLLSQGWAEAAGGNLRQAREKFGEAADKGERIGDHVGALAALHAWARVGYAKETTRRITELGSAVEGDLAATRVAHVRALADADPEGLEAVSGAFEEMGALLLAAEAAADSSVHWARAGNSRAKVSAERRASWLSSRCRGANTPALRAVETRARLTPAEWEAAQLAAAGWSNKDIATELVVSVRTVENRLQHVYGKLGVKSRRELADALATVDNRTPS